jgi:predicted pyridoxine 5'-phosphate oxidase superfamily flavin-nucleotide-binding protein
MGARYHDELFTSRVLAEQQRTYGRSLPRGAARERDALGPAEAEFIAERDSFYMATISESGWPYVQHRGGPPGFIKLLDEHTLVFPDFKGNRQLISSGNLQGDGRVALILVDYPRRERLKLLGHARVVQASDDPELANAAGAGEHGRKVERIFSVDVVGFDWNCPAYITQRYTLAEIEAIAAPLQRRIAELEAELARPRG